jgi:SAM-dependent methyltransferase
MTTGQIHGELWSSGARIWAQLVEPNARPFYDAVQERLGIVQGTRLLDIGCGPGGSALLAAQRGAWVAGLDASPGSIEVARERVPDGDFRVGDMESLPWPDGSFDAVTAFNSLQFAGNPAAALTEARRLLVTDGRLGMVIWAPREESQQTRVIEAIASLGPPVSPDAPGPFALSAPGRAESVLEAAGLHVLERGEVPTVFSFHDIETALTALTASGGAARAIQQSGEERVRETLRAALAELPDETGAIRMQNRFRFLIAAPV